MPVLCLWVFYGSGPEQIDLAGKRAKEGLRIPTEASSGLHRRREESSEPKRGFGGLFRIGFAAFRAFLQLWEISGEA